MNTHNISFREKSGKVIRYPLYLFFLFVSSRGNLTSGFATRVDSNQHAQLQGLEISNIETRGIILSRQRTTKALISLCGCVG